MRADLQGGVGGGESEKKVVGQSESRSPGEELLAEEG